MPSKTRAPSNTEEPSQMAWVRAPHSGTLPSRHSPSKKVQVCDQSAIERSADIAEHAISFSDNTDCDGPAIRIAASPPTTARS